MHKIVVVVAGDHLESRIGAQLGGKLSELGYGVKLFARDGQKVAPYAREDLEKAASHADLVITTSSDMSEHEVMAGEHAVKNGTPLVMCSNGYGCWKNPAFENLREHVDLLLVIDEEEQHAAGPHFPKATTIAVGNPEWEEYSFPTVTRDEVRKLLEIEEGTIMILGAGDKYPMLNLPLFVSLIEALASPSLSMFRETCQLVIGLHPGDLSPPEVYDELTAYAKGVSVRIMRRGDGFWMPTKETLVGADLAVGTNSNVLVGAALLGIPAISNLLRGLFRGRDMGVVQRGWWPPCDRGAVKPVYGISSELMADLIHKFTASPESPELTELREAQRRHCPRPTHRGQVLKLMLEEVAKLL